jgi:hypothetical protein
VSKVRYAPAWASWPSPPEVAAELDVEPGLKVSPFQVPNARGGRLKRAAKYTV